ncbi:hypothetical protein EON65_17525 [archaeon]|nr:MAG: hypothetical protein EON65_17525 [archaeon]
MQKREQYRSFLMQVPILESLTEREILTLADSLAEEKYENNDVICAQVHYLVCSTTNMKGHI